MQLDLVSIGGALVDLIFQVNFNFIERLSLNKGCPIENMAFNFFQISPEGRLKPYISSGGSACNVSKVVGGFGLKAGFIGTIGNDIFGDFFLNRIKKYHVEPLLSKNFLSSTGHTYVFITPDGDRTMCPYYEADQRLSSEEIKKYLKKIGSVKLLFLDCYNLIYRQYLSFSFFKKSPYLIALDLSNKFIVELFREDILDLIYSKSVHLLFTNEEEICALTEIEDPILACYFIESYCDHIILMRGEKGSSAISKNGYQTFPSQEIKFIDRTGAGDVFIGGVIFGYLSKLSLKESLQLGTYAARFCLNTIGAELPMNFFKNHLVKRS